MSQQVLPQYAPMVNVNGTEMIPAAAIGGQTRDGKDEIITGAGNMVFDPSIGDNGMWVPVSEANPLETRVKELEERLGAAVENPAQWTLMDRIKRLESLFESGDAKVTLTGQIEVLAELENVDVPANSIVDIVPRGIRIGYTEVRGGFYVNGAVRGNYELRIRNLQPQANDHHPYSYRNIVKLENDYWGSGRSLGIESVRWGVEFRNLNDFDITLRSVVVMGVR